MSENLPTNEIAEQRINNALRNPVTLSELDRLNVSNSDVPNQDSLTAAQSDND